MDPIVAIDSGKLAGREKRGVQLFAGIPYAAPPVGDRRFKPPEWHEGWDGTREATTFGQQSVQGPRGLGGVLPAQEVDWSEDCLFLNVSTPACDDARRPVMVWIHGGAFVGGTGAMPWYDGAKFATHGDVVVVTINYRLGALGWLHLGALDPAYQASGNSGLLDQIAALEWVQRNIAAFGGNPDDVTIFGESAGGMSVGTLFGTPQAAGLFHKAIPQSGAAHNVTSVQQAGETAERFLEVFGGGLDELLHAPPERVLEAQQKMGEDLVTGNSPGRAGSAAGLPYGPVVDGVVLPEPPLDAVRAGLSKDVPLLIGTTRDEFNLFAIMRGKVDDRETLIRRLGRIIPEPEKVAAPYLEGVHDAAGFNAAMSAIMTDAIFRIPAIRLAEAQAQHQPDNTFMYLFEVESTAFNGVLGSCHALEIPFVFDNLDRPGVEMFAGPDAPQSVADAMHASWIAFARTGDPANDDVPAWPAYGEATRATMHFGEPCHLEDDPAGDRRVVWDGVV